MEHNIDTIFQSIFTLTLFACAAVVVCVALRRPVRNKDRAEVRFRTLVFVGAGLGAVIFEPAGDRLVQCWYYARGGQWTLIALYGVSVPIWALPVYVMFIGASVLWIVHRVRLGTTHWELAGVLAGITAQFFDRNPDTHIRRVIRILGRVPAPLG